MRRALAVAVALACSAADAQVYRCKDPQTGKTTYSQTPCDGGMAVQPSQPAPRQKIRPAPAPQPIGATVQAPRPRQSTDIKDSPIYKQCIAAVTGIDPSGRVGFIPADDIHRKIMKCVNRSTREARAAPAVPVGQTDPEFAVSNTTGQVVKLTGCGPGGCVDSQGNHYSGSGSVMVRQDGKTCVRAGPALHCD